MCTVMQVTLGMVGMKYKLLMALSIVSGCFRKVFRILNGENLKLLATFCSRY